MKILITGGLGYIGGRLSQHLHECGHTVVATTTRCEKFKTSFPFEVRTFDVTKSSISEIACSLHHFDAVVHLASIDENECIRNPRKAVEVNTVGTFKMIEAAKACANIKKFIYLSTVHVYGKLEGLITEKTLTRPTHPYAYTHRAAEDYVLAARHDTEMDAVVLRVSNAFGAPLFPEVDRWTLLANELCRDAAANKALLLRSPLARRDFINLQNVCAGIEHVLGLPKIGTYDGLFNLSSGKSDANIEMAMLIQACCAKELSIFPEIRGCPMPSVPSIDLAISNLKLKQTGFCFNGCAEEEIVKTLRMCKDSF